MRHLAINTMAPTTHADASFEPLNTRDTRETTQSVPNAFNGVDRDEVTPARLVGTVDYDLFEQYEQFEHRGELVNVHMLVDYLATGFNEQAEEDGIYAPASYYGSEPAEMVVEMLEERFPTWFADRENLAGKLISDYYVSERQPAENPVSSEWSSVAQVILPVVALLLVRIEQQMKADANRAKAEAKDEIKRVVGNLAFDHRNELTTDEFREAVSEELGDLPEDWSF